MTTKVDLFDLYEAVVRLSLGLPVQGLPPRPVSYAVTVLPAAAPARSA